MNQNIKKGNIYTGKETEKPSSDFTVSQIKKLIKADFSTDDEGILQFNKNGYQTKISDILNAIDKWYSRYSNSERIQK